MSTFTDVFTKLAPGPTLTCRSMSPSRAPCSTCSSTRGYEDPVCASTLATNTSSMQVGQSAPGDTRIEAPSVAKASFNNANRVSFDFDGAKCNGVGKLRSDVTVIPAFATRADRAGANTPSTNVYRAYP